MFSKYLQVKKHRNVVFSLMNRTKKMREMEINSTPHVDLGTIETKPVIDAAICQAGLNIKFRE